MIRATGRYVAARLAALGRFARGTANQVRKHPYPVLVSFWVALIFTERLIAHQLAYNDSVWHALAKTANVFSFLVSWLLVLLSLLIDRRALAQLRRLASRIYGDTLKDILSPLPLLVCLMSVVIALSIGAARQETMGETFRHVAKDVIQLGVELLPSLAIAGIAGIVYIICSVIYHYLRVRTAAVDEAIHELIISAYFVVANAAIYVALTAILLMSALAAPARGEGFGGLLKDTLVYSLAVLGVVVGTYKAGEVLRQLKEPVYRWGLLAIMGMGTMTCTIPAIMLDLSFKDNVLRLGKAIEYPEAVQQRIIAVHIWVRLGLFVVLFVAAFLRLFSEIERINLEDSATHAATGGQ